MNTFYARITQFLMWPFIFIFVHVFFKVTIRGRENLNLVRSPFIIVSNHVAYFDCFLYRIILGVFTPHLPLRFMAVKSFSSRFLNIFSALGIVNIIYAIFGVFVIVQGQGVEKNLVTATSILQKGGNVVMYPEGHVTRSKTGLDPFRPGAAVLARKTGAPILPISFKITKMNFRNRLVINIGKPFSIDATQNDEENTHQLFATISELYL